MKDKYVVIHPFRDLQDKLKTQPDGRLYVVGDVFPATKRKVDQERLDELASSENLQKKPLIKKVNDEKEGE